ncbi:PIN-like domain-containing protein [Dactylosporangium sp. NPDC051541]|uniref:PIN-like domain-containing protein n=1 Tax=Dactylosporangium sp. NPDC051541 TaxID=3363977 RepID=UPI0037A26CD9
MPLGFSDQFGHYLPPADTDIATALRTGLVALDSNVLLSAYRFAPDARAVLFAAIECLGDRGFVPHQAALEFHANRFTVSADHAAAYEQVLDTVADYRDLLEPDLLGRIRYLAFRTGLDPAARDALQDLVTDALTPLATAVEGLRSRHGLADDDAILHRFQTLLDGRVGAALPDDELAAAQAEARRRVAAGLPPGYMDAEKANPEGDYLIWLQVLDEARRRAAPWVVFVTGDLKEDWWFVRDGGRVACARPELTAEAAAVAGARLVMLTTQAFVRGYDTGGSAA